MPTGVLYFTFTSFARNFRGVGFEQNQLILFGIRHPYISIENTIKSPVESTGDFAYCRG